MTTTEFTQHMQAVQAKQTKVNNALDNCGIGHDVYERYSDTMEHVAKFCADLTARAAKQAMYDLTNNVPLGILPQHMSAENRAQHAITNAISGAVGAQTKWDITDAGLVAVAILTEVNAHTEAKKLHDMLYQPV